jgi:predicted small lipoprotein YifL
VKGSTRLLGLLVMAALAACGKKGPPLPPLVRIPTPPGAFSVQRQGTNVVIQLAVPGDNTDGSKPADLTRVDVFALTSGAPVNPDEIYRRGARVGRVLVNPPPDPDTPDGEPRKPSGPLPPGGIDQGATAHLSEAFEPVQNGDSTDIRYYMAVGFNKHGRHGPYSPPVTVPVGDPPAPPGKPEVDWDEASITIKWPAAPEPAGDGVALSYNVYAAGDVPLRLTTDAVGEKTFVDKRIEWGAERCYVVRSVEKFAKMSLESEASPETCVTLVDHFAPAAPEGLTIVASEGAMNLIWNPNHESDLAGYVLWRAILPEGDLKKITPDAIKETTYKDTVPAGARVAYAVQAVDKAGNVSPMSMRVEESAR